MDEELRSHLAQMERRIVGALTERIRGVETLLLTEFHKWASPVEMRARSHAAALRATDAELEALRDRVENVEGHAPPPVG